MFDSKEEIGNNVTISWSVDKSSVLITLPESSRNSVDIYINTNLEILQNWDVNKPIYMIQNVSSGQVQSTPYLKGRLEEINNVVKTRKINAYVALIIRDDFVGHIMRTFGRLFASNVRTLDQRFFTDQQQAEEWVAKQQANAQ